MYSKLSIVKKFGLPRIIISLFLIALFILSPLAGVSIDRGINDVIGRFGMFSILVLSMVPMIQSGCGLNFGIPVGIIAGIIGAVTSIEFGFNGFLGMLVAVILGTLAATIFGFLYGFLLNRIKGDEMLIATYVGYFFVALMSIMWVVLPYRNPVSVMGYGGSGLRQQIPVSDYWMTKTVFEDGTSKTVGMLSKFLEIKITENLVIPTGMILFFALVAFIVWAFFKTKTGTSITAVGSNPEYAKASGININRMRMISVIFSTILAAIGIIVYQQSYGYIQLYTAPTSFTFQSVAAILIGGASVNKASIVNVVIGTILFQGILTMTPTVINGALNIDISEILRIIVTNGMIIYALTRRDD